VFAGSARAWSDVMVAGRWVVRDGVHAQAAPIAARFERAMGSLWTE
jgi:formimidoylglutamate deiminase